MWHLFQTNRKLAILLENLVIFKDLQNNNRENSVESVTLSRVRPNHGDIQTQLKNATFGSLVKPTILYSSKSISRVIGNRRTGGKLV